MRYLELVNPHGGLYFAPTRRPGVIIGPDGRLIDGGIWTTIGMPGYYDLDRLLDLESWAGRGADDRNLRARQEQLCEVVRQIRARLRQEAEGRGWSRELGMPTSFEEEWRYYAQCLRILQDTLFWAHRYPSGTWRVAGMRSALEPSRAHACDYDPAECAGPPAGRDEGPAITSAAEHHREAPAPARRGG